MSVKNLLPFIAVVLLLLSSCGDETTPDYTEFEPLYEVAQVLESMDASVISYSNQGKEAQEALLLGMADIRQNSLVDTAWQMDSAYVFVELKSGLQTIYYIAEMDVNEAPVTRGGGGGSQPLAINTWKQATSQCSNEMENKKILLFNAEFTTTQKGKDLINNNKDKLGLELNELTGKNCKLDVLSTFKDYGLVVLNTHGFPNGFQIGENIPAEIKQPSATLETFAESLNSNQDQRITDLLRQDLMRITRKRKYFAKVPINVNTYNDADDHAYFITGKYISQLQGLEGTIVFGNMCYSGYESTQGIALKDIPIATAFKQANVLTYYGYQTTTRQSYPVQTNAAEVFEELLYAGFFEDNDSTGIANLRANGDEYHDTLTAARTVQTRGKLFFRQFLDDTYCFGGCGDTLTDSRDGQKYATTCIGEQEWMARNLNWAGGGQCFNGSQSNCDTYGRIYDLTEIKSGTLCPSGWHIPTRSEVEELISFVSVNTLDAGKKLKATTLWPSPNTATDEYGFGALPGGLYKDGMYTPHNIGSYTTSDLILSSGIESLWTYTFSIHDNVSITGYSNIDSGFGIYCRCVKD